MLMKTIVATLLLTGAAVAGAAQDCSAGTARSRGQVVDPTGAAVATAKVALKGAMSIRVDSEGRFQTACLPMGGSRGHRYGGGFSRRLRWF